MLIKICSYVLNVSFNIIVHMLAELFCLNQIIVNQTLLFLILKALKNVLVIKNGSFIVVNIINNSQCHNVLVGCLVYARQRT